MANLIQDYLDATKKLKASREAVDATVAVIEKTAGLLKGHLRTFSMSNVATVSFPTECAYEHGACIDANDWPSANKLAETLCNWHSAREKVKAAWSLIPDDDREGLVPPKES